MPRKTSESGGEGIPWQDAHRWVTEAGKIGGLPSEVRPASGVEEFAIDLANGSVLCKTLNVIHKGAVRRIHQGQDLKQYQCKMNSDQFLSSCCSLFQWTSEALFQPDDLYRGSRFERVVQTLSKLSHTSNAKALGLKPFPDKEVTIYEGGREDDDEEEEESIYTNVKEMMEKRRVAHRPSASRALPTRRSAPEVPAYASSEPNDEPEEDIYGEVSKIIGAQESIYDSMVTAQVRRATGTIARNKTKRDFIRDELVDTEKGYLDALRSIQKVYILPLEQDGASVGIPSPSATDRLFINLPKMIPIHKKLVMRLQRMDNVGDVFRDAAVDMLLYAEYCSKLNDAQQLIDELQQSNRDAWAFLEKLRTQAPQGFDLKSMLCLPMQRMLKYPLLLKELRKSTPPTHPEHGPLGGALEAIQELARYIDESTRDWENLKQCQDIQSSVQSLDGLRDLSSGAYGRYLMDDEVKIRLESDPRKRLEKYYVFAFQKILLVTKQDRGKSEFCFKFPMDVAHFSVKIAAKEKKHRGQDVALKLTASVPSSEAYSCTMFFKTGATRVDWEEGLKISKMELMPPSVMRPTSTDSNSSMTQACNWMLCTFPKATPCFVCRKLLRGLVSQGYRCGGDHASTGCQKCVHLECTDKVPLPCPGQAARQSARARAWKNLGGPKSMAEADAPLPQVPAPRRGHSGTISRSNKPPATSSERTSTTLDTPPTIVPRPSRRQSHAVIQDGSRRAHPQDGSRRAHPAPASQSENTSEQAPPPLLPRASSMRARAPDPPQASANKTSTVARGSGLSKDTSTKAYMNQLSGNGYVNLATSQGRPSRAVKTERWYVGKLSRSEAGALFDGASLGSYLVRGSTREGREGSYTLDVAVGVEGGGVKHVPIEFDSGLYSVSRKKKFLSVPDLIAHYQVNSLIEHFPNVDTTLCTPIGTRSFVDDVYEVVRAHVAQRPEELSVVVGQRVCASERSTSGWLPVQTSDLPPQRGLVPEGCLQCLE